MIFPRYFMLQITRQELIALINENNTDQKTYWFSSGLMAIIAISAHYENFLQMFLYKYIFIANNFPL